jgi:lysophospholipase L1-like esterase
MFWYHDDVERLEKKIKQLDFRPKMIFYGSSTFTLWEELEELYKPYKPLNLGFGGSTLAACTWFFDRIFKNIEKPESIVIYAGDNDLGNGRHPEEVIAFLENLLVKINSKYGDIECTVISIKPSIARYNLLNSIHFTNGLIKELMANKENYSFVDIYDAILDSNKIPNKNYFEQDGLHFNDKGYEIIIDKLENQAKIKPQKTLIKL